MKSASKSTLSLNNIMILRPKVTKILQICVRKLQILCSRARPVNLKQNNHLLTHGIVNPG